MASTIDVAAGALRNSQGEILLAQRPEGKHMAGYWEFPGGKFESGEGPEAALARELSEELGVDVTTANPLITLVHSYPDRTVRLHVWEVNGWLGEPKGLDQQALTWVKPEKLSSWDLLPADKPIVTALQLPDAYAISPDFSNEEWPRIQNWLMGLLDKGVKCFQWRQNDIASDITKRVATWAKQHGLVALLNGAYDGGVMKQAAEYGYTGVHLKSNVLVDLKNLNAEAGVLKHEADQLNLRWLAGSCHSSEDINKARTMGLDFVVLGPLRQTASHPQASAMGWEKFKSCAIAAGLPVYALGGCNEADFDMAREHGAQGIAGISAFL